MDASQLNWLYATDAARAVRDGAISSEQLVEACLARIRETEPAVQAWQFLDPEHALRQARELDDRRRQGGPTGPLPPSSRDPSHRKSRYRLRAGPGDVAAVVRRVALRRPI